MQHNKVPWFLSSEDRFRLSIAAIIAVLALFAFLSPRLLRGGSSGVHPHSLGTTP